MSGETMNKPIDLFIGKLMKNWVEQHKPPVNGRARLLSEAARAVPRDAKQPVLVPDHGIYPHHKLRADECAQALFVLVNETVFRSGLQLRVI
jgi:hypothetical protein